MSYLSLRVVIVRALLACVFMLLSGVAPAHQARAGTNWVEAGPIWNNMDAQRKCPQVCGASRWDGNWKTTEMGRMSVCACSGAGKSWGSSQRVREVDAGPIWGDFEAPKKCKAACGSLRWNGNWRTVGAGRSTCDCEQ